MNIRWIWTWQRRRRRQRRREVAVVREPIWGSSISVGFGEFDDE